MTTIKSKNFKATYLQLLTHGSPAKDDYWAAKELIDNGHATGKYLIDKTRQSHGEITNLLGFTPTMSGRLFADQLADQLRKSTWRYRVMQAAIAVFSFGGGWLAGVMSQVTASALTKWLGVG